METRKLYQLVYQSLLELATDEGINASGKDEVFGCIFGRDSAITILKILRAHSKKPQPKLLEISRRALLTLTHLQGKEFNIESGEQPGKFIHEFRRSKFDHLTALEKPWFIYPDQTLRNYDSIDSTPLSLIAIFKYWETTQDNEFLLTVLPSVEAGLNWIVSFGDIDKDGLIEYELPENRRFGGLNVQSWTDSHQSILRPDGRMPSYPIAPIEAQAFAWLALKLWSDFYQDQSPVFAKKLLTFANRLKEKFNHHFTFEDQGLSFGAQALDGEKNQIKTITANPLLALWAAYTKDGKTECIVDSKLIPDWVARAFEPDMFIEDAGIRTMSSLSPTFNPSQDSYHNGSFWPMVNGLIAEGLGNFGFFKEAARLKTAALLPLTHFQTPIELYNRNNQGYCEYLSPSGQKGCRVQAWSAAAFLDMTADSTI